MSRGEGEKEKRAKGRSGRIRVGRNYRPKRRVKRRIKKQREERDKEVTN